MKPATVKAFASKLPSPAILLTLFLLGLHAIPAPGEPWMVPEGLPHQGGFAAGTPGLRPVSCLEFFFLTLDGRAWLAGFAMGLVGIILSRRFSSLGPVVVVLAITWWIHAPAAQHRCFGPQTVCRHNLENLFNAAERFQEDRGSFPQSLEDLNPEYLAEVPSCPLVGQAYTLHSENTVCIVRCRPHPVFYAGNLTTSFGKSYLSRQTGEQTPEHGSEVELF